MLESSCCSTSSRLIGPHLHQSQPRWRCRWRPSRGSSQSSSPSRTWCWSSRGSPRGASGAAQGPSRHRLEPSESLCQSPGSASDTSGSSPPSTAGLQGEHGQIEGGSFIHLFIYLIMYLFNSIMYLLMHNPLQKLSLVAIHNTAPVTTNVSITETKQIAD